MCGNTLAYDANGPGSTPGGTLELDTCCYRGHPISKQWVTAVEDGGGNCRHSDAPATCPVYRPLQDLQVLGYGNKR